VVINKSALHQRAVILNALKNAFAAVISGEAVASLPRPPPSIGSVAPPEDRPSLRAAPAPSTQEVQLL
jgi:hypothetical protein